MVKIPSRLEELIPAAALEKVMQVLNQPDIPGSVREALNKVGWKDANPLGQVQDAWQQARSWLDSLAGSSSKSDVNPSILNATGALLHPDFEGVPMSSSVAFDFAKAATSFQSGASLRSRAKHAAELILGHPTAWVSSPQLALQLLQLESIAPSGIVISRADAVRVPGFGDVRAMLTTLTGRLTEVGAANGATENDWNTAVHSAKQAIVLVSPSQLPLDIADEQRGAAIRVAKKSGATVVEILIDGVFSQELSDHFGFANVKQRLDSGADIVLLPLHFLLAGPEGIMIFGKEKVVRAMHSAAEALHGQMSGARLSAAIIALQLANISDEIETGVAGQLLANAENLKNRAMRLAVQLNDTKRIAQAVEVERECPLGPTPWDRYKLHNWAVRITPRESVEHLQRDLLRGDATREGAPLPVATAISGTELYIDLRFIAPEDDHEIVVAATSGE